ATTKTPLPVMKSWIDTTAVNDNIWLVLVIHGVGGIGWEALTSESLEEYFQYMKTKDEDLWIATFADATKYMRGRMNATVKTIESKNKIIVNLSHSLDNIMYDLPLTLKTYIPPAWKNVQIKQGNENKNIRPGHDSKGSY